MDDYSSRKQIDELAELYLTGVIDQDNTDAPGPSPVEGPAPIRLSPKPASDTTARDEPHDRHPVLRLTEADNGDANAIRTESINTEKPTDSAQTTDHADEPAPQAMLEAVLLGNLPGMSGPWLTQYAQLIAQSEGPVAVLHVGENAIDLELVEPRPEAEPAPTMPTPTVRIPPMRGNRTGLVGLLDALTRSDNAPTRTILVRLESTNDPRSLTQLAAIDDWTLLCGADEASVANATRQLRSLVNADPRLADRHVGLMVMGSDEPTARATADRIATDAAHDLVNRVELIGHLKRMQPVQVREIGSFPDPLGVWPQLVAWFDTLEVPEPMQPIVPINPEQAPQPQPAAVAPPRPATPATGTAEIKPQRLSPAAAKLAMPPSPASRPEHRPSFTPTPPSAPPTRKPRDTARNTETNRLRDTAPTRPAAAPPPAREPEHRPVASPRQAQAEPQPQPEPQLTRQPLPQPAAQTRRDPAAPAPAVARASEPTRPAPQPRVLARQAELDLIALLNQGPAALDDPAPLEARIPDQPDTQLAVDAEGVVHILLKKGSDPVNTDDAASLDARQAVMQLIEAGRWVREHLELLALTQRDRTFIDAEPVLHLMTDRADLTTRLVGKLAGQVKLHLLQQVKLGRESGWFCTPLG